MVAIIALLNASLYSRIVNLETRRRQIYSFLKRFFSVLFVAFCKYILVQKILKLLIIFFKFCHWDSESAVGFSTFTFFMKLQRKNRRFFCLLKIFFIQTFIDFLKHLIGVLPCVFFFHWLFLLDARWVTPDILFSTRGR